jgi:uncharacterized YigZ family protein
MDITLSTFTTIQNNSTGEYREKGSTFYGFAYPIATEEEFKQYLQQLKNEHPQAVHFCYAFRYGVQGQHYRYSDDGEPANSGGKPIYGQLLSFNITNIALIVVRYYGGIKLGVGGLITAYREAAKSALLHAEMITLETQFVLTLTFPYEKTALYNTYMHAWKPTILAQHFDVDCSYRLSFPMSKQKEILDQLNVQNDLNWELE